MKSFHRFTIKAQEALQNAQDLASQRNHGEFKAIHLLSALLSDSQSLTQPLLLKAGINLDILNNEIEAELKKLPKIFSGMAVGQLYLSQEVMLLIDKAAKIAIAQKDDFISCEHLLLAIIETNSSAKNILERFNLRREILLRILSQLRGSMRVTDETPESKFQVLDKYAVNLTQKARDGSLDPVVGREEELRRIIQVLSRRTKNNPILIGEPGVGKTAIVEGLAQKIVSGDIPGPLRNKEIIMLDLGSLIAGTKFRGEFEDRLKAFMREIQNSAGQLLLFIDEIHMIVGAGAAEGAIDASNLLKPALARGELHAIGATTVREYQKHIEKDAALERRFQPIMVDEPTIENAISILRGLKEKYEIHHGLRIGDEAIIASVNLSARYITDRFLPDKAVDLMDEASAARMLETESVPADIEKIKREITQLEIEKSALVNETRDKRQGVKDDKNKERIKVIDKNLIELREKNDELSSRWKNEKTSFENLHNLRRQIDHLRHQAEQYEREGDLEKVAQITYGELPAAEKEYVDFQKKYSKKQTSNSKMIKEFVDEEDIAQVVSRWTGIPVFKMLQSESDKLINLEKVLSERVVGQKEAVSTISFALRRARAGLSDEHRPLGSFIFLGPTGVGKTELAKALAEFMFNDEKALIRIDMSEYMEKHAVARLIGAPPGYIGHDEGGQLTEIVRHRPYSIILFDEIEKAHPEVFNILLQVLDNGRLTDGRGKLVNFRNCIIILTSNIGGHYFREMSQLGFAGDTKNQVVKQRENNFKEKVKESLRETFKPEFLNRLDEVIIFNPLYRTDIAKIVDIQLDRVLEKLKQKNIKAIIDPAAKQYIVDHGFSVEYGARPIRRLIQKIILDKLADQLIRGEIKDGSKVKISFSKSALVINA